MRTFTKNVLPDTLYITLKVIDRARINDPEFYSEFDDDLNNLSEKIRNLLDKLDMAESVETRKAG